LSSLCKAQTFYFIFKTLIIIDLTGTEIYQQAIDKQRILVVGGGNDLITSIIVHTLRLRNRKFDTVISGKPVSLQKDAHMVIIDNGLQPLDYKHHIVVFGNSASNEKLPELAELADATPKGGTIIYPKNHPELNKIGSKERTDVQTIPYEVYKSEIVEGKTVLISSTKEKIPVELNGDLELQCVSAAKELLKKIGISSGNFYKAISEFKPA
jgi:UDP-N-acetylmuramate: L-alanyl-gamma-D-glutamyl-meso-diaminopimelate ligase